MTKAVWLCSLAMIFFNGEALAGQAAAAPTRPVYSKNLNAPTVTSDTRNLEAIVDNETVAVSEPAAPVNPAPALAPQTILVMPSAAQPPAPAAATAPVHNDVAAAAIEETHDWRGWLREPTSVFTACIALFTFMLALLGVWHVYGAGARARRQLRAYVFITGTEINGVVATGQPVAQLAIRNTGQTPAHDVVVYGNMVFDEFPLKKDLPVLVFSDPQLTQENIGPGADRYKWEYALTPLTLDQMEYMNSGTHALYVYGEIHYRDVFGKKRSTKYLYYTGGTMGIRGNILGGYPQGNEAV